MKLIFLETERWMSFPNPAPSLAFLVLALPA
jgi:hypothetical protein